jgi:hypothetical protein
MERILAARPIKFAATTRYSGIELISSRLYNKLISN